MRFFLRFFVPFHNFVFRLTRGRALGEFELPVLLLTTTGRRSGKQRTIPLLYLEEDGTLMVEVKTRASRRWMRAEPLVGEDRHRRFERIKAAANRYATYESHTDREIPVVALREVSTQL